MIDLREIDHRASDFRHCNVSLTRGFPARALRADAGSVLLEIVVSTVVISVGLLGLAGLHMAGVAKNQTAYLRAQAAMQAYDIADRMRANPQARYDLVTKPASHEQCRNAPRCDPQQIAENDLFEWNQLIRSILPGGYGVVCFDSTPNDGVPDSPACDGHGRQHTIKIWWSHSGKGQPFRLVTSVQP